MGVENAKVWTCSYCAASHTQEGPRAQAMPSVPPLGWYEVSIKRFVPTHTSGTQKIGDQLDDKRKYVCPHCCDKLETLLTDGVSICIDCDMHHQHTGPLPGLTCNKSGSGACHEGTPPKGFICEHFDLTYWVDQGFVRNWGDAAVSNWPYMEILRRDKDGRVEYVILAPYMLRRPVTIWADRKEAADKEGEAFSWGGY